MAAQTTGASSEVAPHERGWSGACPASCDLPHPPNQHHRDGFADWRGMFMDAVTPDSLLEEFCEQLEVTPIHLPSGRPAPQQRRLIKASKMRILTVLSAMCTLAVGRRDGPQESGHDIAPRLSGSPLMRLNAIRDTGSGTCQRRLSSHPSDRVGSISVSRPASLPSRLSSCTVPPSYNANRRGPPRKEAIRPIAPSFIGRRQRSRQPP